VEKVYLQASKRDIVGKHVKSIRREGGLPAIIYGKELKEPMPITLDLRDTTKFMRHVTPSTVVTIKVNGKEFPTLVRDRQHEVLTGAFLHIDFMAISLSEKVRTLVNLQIDGEAPVVKLMDAIMITGVDQIEVEALPQDLPESILVDISGLESIGDGIYVKDLVLPQGVECLTEPEEMIVVATAQEMEAAEEEEAGEEGGEGGEPEVIEKGKKEEED